MPTTPEKTPSSETGVTTVLSTVATPVLTVEWAMQEEATAFRRIHCLPQPTLVYLPDNCRTSVEGYFAADHEPLAFEPFGPAVFVPGQVPLHIFSRGNRKRGMLICRFQPAPFQNMLEEAAPGLARPSACHTVNSPALLKTLARLATEMQEGGVARDTIVAGLGLILLGELGRHFAGLAFRRPGQLAPWQLTQIENRLADPKRPLPSLCALAALCGISPRHLGRRFKATTGETPGARLQRARHTRATVLLEAHQLSIAEIAAQLGYRRAGSFSSAFGQHFGETPQRYRQRAAARGTA